MEQNTDDDNRVIPDEQRLMNHILKGYEKAVRPVQNASTAVIVKMGLTLTQIFDMASTFLSVSVLLKQHVLFEIFLGSKGMMGAGLPIGTWQIPEMCISKNFDILKYHNKNFDWLWTKTFIN